MFGENIIFNSLHGQHACYVVAASGEVPEGDDDFCEGVRVIILFQPFPKFSHCGVQGSASIAAEVGAEREAPVLVPEICVQGVVLT